MPKSHNKQLDIQLIESCLIGNIDIIEALIKDGADINSHNQEGVSPLMAAVSAGQIEVVNKLLECQANVNAKDISGNTALIYGALNGNSEIIEILLLSGASINDQTDEGISPLMAAVRAEHINVIKKLLKYQANINAKDITGHTALMNAALNGNSEIIEILLSSGARVNDLTIESATALIIAASNNHEQAITILIDKGADVNAKDSCGNTSLMNAAEFDNLNIVNKLLAAGADVTAKNDENITALMEAAQNGHSEIVARLILAIGANNDFLNSKDVYGNTALMWAARSSEHNALAELLAAGAPTDVVNVKGKTAFNIIPRFYSDDKILILLILSNSIDNIFFNRSDENKEMLSNLEQDGIFFKTAAARLKFNISNYAQAKAEIIFDSFDADFVLLKALKNPNFKNDTFNFNQELDNLVLIASHIAEINALLFTTTVYGSDYTQESKLRPFYAIKKALISFDKTDCIQKIKAMENSYYKHAYHQEGYKNLENIDISKLVANYNLLNEEDRGLFIKHLKEIKEIDEQYITPNVKEFLELTDDNLIEICGDLNQGLELSNTIDNIIPDDITLIGNSSNHNEAV